MQGDSVSAAAHRHSQGRTSLSSRVEQRIERALEEASVCRHERVILGIDLARPRIRWASPERRRESLWERERLEPHRQPASFEPLDEEVVLDEES